MSALLMWLVLAAAAPTAAPADCPPPGMAWPRYPIDELRNNRAGKTIILARIDECGRVVEAKVETSSGKKTLDDAAMVAARSSVLSQEQRAKIGGEWVKLPFAFGGVSTVKPEAPDWPKSHRKPRYLPDDQPLGFDSIKAVNDAKLMRDVVLNSPYGRAEGGKGKYVTTSFMQEEGNRLHFWLDYRVVTRVVSPSGETRHDGQTIAMARYRLVEEDGKPVVRLGLLCEAEPDECRQLHEFLLQGLPIARPPRR